MTQGTGMEEMIRAALARIAADADTMCGMMALRFEACNETEGTLTVSMAARPWMANPMGIMHGGLISSALDSAMGTLSSYLVGGERRTPTVTMQITYLRPVPLTGRVFLKARILSKGKTLNHLNAELWAEGDEYRVLATATGSFFSAQR